MGLSSSQARLLNLTARMHDIEYKAQNLEAQKLQMANESRQVYTEYENALNKQKVQFKQIGADGSANYIDASISTLLDAGYKIKILKGNTWTDSIKSYAGNKLGKWNTTEDTIPGTILPSSGVKVDDIVTATTGSGENETTTKYKVSKITSAGAAEKGYKFIETNDTELAKIDVTNKETLRNLVEAGFIVFEKPMPDGSFSEVNIATDTSLQEVSDELDLKKAEAKYEADMRKIDAKDKKFDTDLAALEQERNAIKTEMDTLKTVAKDNVDRTFKLFS